MKRMPNIKSLFICLSVLIFQNGFSQTRFGFFGGVQARSARYRVMDMKQPVESKIGLQLGATYKIPFEYHWYFAPAVYYSLKGYKVTLNQPSFPPDVNAINNNTSIHTIEIAPLLNYDFSRKPNHFFIKAGPAVDFALYGKESFDTKDNKHIDREMKFSYADYGVYTAQAILHFGYEMANGLFFFTHLAWGFGSLNNADKGPNIMHRIGGLSIGYYPGSRFK